MLQPLAQASYLEEEQHTMLPTKFPTMQTTMPDNKQFTIYVLETMEVALIQQSNISYQTKLRELMPNTEFTFVTDNAQGSSELASELLTQRMASNLHTDLYVGIATVATKALLNSSLQNADNKSNQAMPMQFMVVSDPVSVGLVSAIGHMSHINMTGITHVVAAKTKLQLLDQIIKTPLRIGLVYSDYPSELTASASILAEADVYPKLTFIPIVYEFASGDNALAINRQRIIDKLAAMAPQIDAYWLPPGPAAHDLVLYDTIQDAVAIPQIFSEDANVVKQGALFGVMCDENIIGQSAALVAKKILQGTPAQSIPITESDTFIVAININTALAMNIIFPSTVLSLADKHIYR